MISGKPALPGSLGDALPTAQRQFEDALKEMHGCGIVVQRSGGGFMPVCYDDATGQIKVYFSGKWQALGTPAGASGGTSLTAEAVAAVAPVFCITLSGRVPAPALVELVATTNLTGRALTILGVTFSADYTPLSSTADLYVGGVTVLSAPVSIVDKNTVYPGVVVTPTIAANAQIGLYAASDITYNLNAQVWCSA